MSKRLGRDPLAQLEPCCLCGRPLREPSISYMDERACAACVDVVLEQAVEQDQEEGPWVH